MLRRSTISACDARRFCIYGGQLMPGALEC